MEPRAHHVLIGLFTLIVATAAVLFALWISKSGNDDQVKDYEVVFNEAVRGLSRGSAVQYNGIRVGEVRSLQLDPQDLRRVKALISVQTMIPIKEDTRARLALTSITGQSVIELSGGSPNSPTLQASEDHLPVIVATPSPIAQLMSGGEELMTDISTLLNRANAILSPENATHISASLDQLEHVLTKLSTASDGIPALVEQLNNAGGQAAQFFAQTQRLVDQQGKQVLNTMNTTLSSFTQLSKQLDQLVQNNAAMVGRGVQGFAELEPTMRELRRTLATLRQVGVKLEDNPSGFLLGNEQIQEFRP